ncbi:glycoside hydrolase family 32 protein [Commensalibacter oyaizuii]|uniref:Sucrose-6-phosphate hydrolase n=1 Tax=Commensalibacter oyaizuii TaxID=3043873 RepID=A0ABT6Q319_9PROT|nr:sucrose-6-phosphate hydrolase [Commensalibacter sp. TBRC 16381]MDI2091522.1 sucrose-6-phosphate hydrolase [Commensalibacter sp. TBRC 16381]
MKALSQADIFVKNAAKTVDTLYYPKFHVAAEAGWINDPNGLIYINGYYHFFFQHYPYEPVWGPMHWGHVISKDLVHWEHLPIALYPDEDYDRDGCYSGSAVNNNGVLTLIYTGNVNLDDKGNIRQVQCMATSTDGINFTKHGPVLFPPAGVMHFRDPKVWRARDSWWMVVGARVNDLGETRLYKSANLTDWTFVTILDQATSSDQGFMWECPDFFNVNNKDILITSPQGMPASGYDYRNLFQSGYRCGVWNEDGSYTVEEEFKEIDHGHDFYAPQSFVAADGRRIMVGWMQMWEAPIPTEKQGWAGAFTLPREVKYNEHGRLLCTPITELEQLRTASTSLQPFKITNQSTVLDAQYQELKLCFDIKNSTAERYGLSVGDGAKLFIDSQAKRLVLERYSDDLTLNTDRSIPLPVCSKINLHIFIDAGSIEVFVNDGEASITSNIFPRFDNKALSFFAENGSAVITKADMWQLSSIFANC